MPVVVEHVTGELAPESHATGAHASSVCAKELEC